jgi:hypothetical protein
MKHLDEASITALLEGTSPVSAELRTHLQEPCEECERLLERISAFDGEVDAVLLRLARRGEAPGAPIDEVGFQRVWRQVKPRGGRYLVPAFAAAAVLAIGVFTALRPAVDPARGLKGNPRIAVELSAAMQDSAGVMRRVEPGEVLPSTGVLLLRYHATEEGRAILLRRASAGPPEPLGTFALVPGTHDLRAGADLAGIPLSSGSGDLTLYLVAAPFAEALTLESARAAIESPASSHTLSVVAVHFDLEPMP